MREAPLLQKQDHLASGAESNHGNSGRARWLGRRPEFYSALCLLAAPDDESGRGAGNSQQWAIEGRERKDLFFLPRL